MTTTDALFLSLFWFCLGCIYLSETTIFAVRVRLLKKSYKETRKRNKDSNLIYFCYLTSWVGTIDFIILSLQIDVAMNMINEFWKYNSRMLELLYLFIYFYD